jgi:hypothetical protein
VSSGYSGIEADSDVAGELMIDLVGADGRILWANAEEARALGTTAGALANLPIESIYAPASVDAIHAMLRRPPAPAFARTAEVDLVGRGGQVLHTLARCRSVEAGLRIAKMDFSGVRAGYERLATDNAILRNIVEDAAEAHWCIEFLEPVDVAQPRAEIVRQIFENQSIWRMCNRAMADLHHLPHDVDFNSQSVRLYWPRNPENEAFAERIIDGDYAIDRAVSVDLLHDGTPMYLENDVRAEIADGYLRRLWGNCRDVSDRERRLKGEKP